MLIILVFGLLGYLVLLINQIKRIKHNKMPTVSNDRIILNWLLLMMIVIGGFGTWQNYFASVPIASKGHHFYQIPVRNSAENKKGSYKLHEHSSVTHENKNSELMSSNEQPKETTQPSYNGSYSNNNNNKPQSNQAPTTRQVDAGTETYVVKGEPTVYSWTTTTTHTVSDTEN